MLFASLVDDPSSHPDRFSTEKAQQAERDRLHEIIKKLVLWENTNNEAVLQEARNEIMKSTGGNPPPVLDPFCGGGSIPLEAQRLGLEAHGSDLNPVAVLITKALIEIPPRFADCPPVNPAVENRMDEGHWIGAQGLANDVRYYGKWMRDEAYRRIGHLYPRVKLPDEYGGGEATVIAWLWARTVKCPNPACGAQMPLVRSFELSKKTVKRAWVEPIVDQRNKTIHFEVRTGEGKARDGTVNRSGGSCIVCGTAVPFDHIRSEGKAGRMSAKLMAIVAEGVRGRVYLSPNDENENIARNLKPKWKPDTELLGKAAVNVPLYGIKTHADLFTSRQLVALTTFSDLVIEARERVFADARVRFQEMQAGRSRFQGMQAGRSRSQGMQAGRSRSQEMQAGRSRSHGPQASCLHNQDLHNQGWHSRGYLPHFDGGEIPQTITFRLADSFPKEYLDAWREELRHLPSTETEMEYRRRIESYLDSGQGETWLADPRIAALVENALLKFDGVRYHLHAWVIMPNHVHVLVTPREGYSLSDILHSWKSFTAKEANRLLGRTGSFWQQEYFDRYIRDERHFTAAVEYIENNPVKAGLCKARDEWEFSSAKGVEDEMRAGGTSTDPSAGGTPAIPSVSVPGSVGVSPAPPDLPLHEGGTGAQAYADAVATYLGLSVDRIADRSSTICSWDTGYVKVRNTFARQAIPMTWDYAESNPFSDSTGNFLGALSWIAESIENSSFKIIGCAKQLDASISQTQSINPLVSTDPPYYDNIGYADLSDFFYIWLRRCLNQIYPNLFGTLLVPKSQELVATPYRFDGDKNRAKEFFESGLRKAFSNIRQTQNFEYPMTVFYAFKQAESNNSSERGIVSTGWETMLKGLIDTGFSIHGTWPMRTELSNRTIASGTNALASSIVIVCRPRAEDAPMTTRRDFLNQLKRQLPKDIATLQKSNIAPVDLAQASIGPGMAVFSRYSKVVEADGSPMSVRTALALINQTLDEYLSEQESEYDADTRWAIAWFEQNGFEDGPYGDAETLSRAKNTSVQGLVNAGILRAKGGKVRLLPRHELPTDWDPFKDNRTPVWEITQHLIRKLQSEGNNGAAVLLVKLGGMGGIARELAYRLYTLCERKGWAPEALAYNSLVIAWPVIFTKAKDLTRTSTQAKDQDFEHF